MIASMSGPDDSPPARPMGIGVVGAACLLGLVGGLAVGIVAEVLSRPWGNGALVVPFSGLPALLAGGWVALLLRRRRVRWWATGGVVAGLIVLSVALLMSFSAVLLALGPALPGATLLLRALQWAIALVVAAGSGAVIATRASHESRRPRGAALLTVALAGAILLVAGGIGLDVLLIFPLLPIAVAAPLLATPVAADGPSRSGWWLALAMILLPIALLVGYAGGAIVGSSLP